MHTGILTKIIFMNRPTSIACMVSFFACWCFFIACSKKADLVTSPANFVPPGVTADNVTYTNYVSIILKNNCSTCHGLDGSAAHYWYNDNTYSNASANGRRIMETIVENSMPPVPRKPFSQEDKALLIAWINRGTPE
jgi:hypothetical protein